MPRSQETFIIESSHTLNIYLEQFIAQKERKNAWDAVLSSKEFLSMFSKTEPNFEVDHIGLIKWRNLFIFPVSGNYEIESYQEGLHLLMKVYTIDFSSSLLLTLEENQGAYLLRIDHRSFYGTHKKIHHNSFLRRWKKLMKHFVIKQESS